MRALLLDLMKMSETNHHIAEFRDYLDENLGRVRNEHEGNEEYEKFMQLLRNETEQLDKRCFDAKRSIQIVNQREQYNSITKAINNIETPVKEKHVRCILIGTHQEKASTTFWHFVRRLDLQGNPICCWKFCHVLHKVLHDGYKKSIADAYTYRGLVRDLGKLWGCLREGYGKLIHHYCTLLVTKIEFHARNPRFPGDLKVTDAELDNIGESDVNVFFQLVCEMFDYLDEILTLQAAVFGSLDMAKANSMTNSGQCRLAPLIVCIQDSSRLYDCCVKVLFKLHAVLPPGTLDGHRDRFYKQYKILRQFYANSSNLQYFKPLIKIPPLPENPPNFLHQHELRSHVTPVVILPQQSDSPDDTQSITDTLIDLSFANSNDSQLNDDTLSLWSVQTSTNGQNNHQNIIEEKDQTINQLYLRNEELQQLLRERETVVDVLKRNKQELEASSGEHERLVSRLNEKKDALAKEFEELRQELERHRVGTDMHTELEKAEAKFIKMREAYTKLREEHIPLLRTKAELDKQLATLKAESCETSKRKQELEAKLQESQRATQESEDHSRKLNDQQQRLDTAETLNKKLLTEIAQLQQYKNKVDADLASAASELSTAKNSLHAVELKANEKLSAREWHFLGLVIREMQAIAKKTSNESDAANVQTTVHCSPEHFFLQCEILNHHLNSFINVCPSLATVQPQFDDLIQIAINYNHQLCTMYNEGRLIDQTLPDLALGQELMMLCKQLVMLSVDLGNRIVAKGHTREILDAINKCLQDIINLKRRILPAFAVDVNKDIGELLEEEMKDMTKAIQDAANRIEQMMIQAKQKDTGVKLEVNGKILDACTTLMQRIIQLIKDARALQEEIKAKGRGTANPKEFYQRNHRWTEGLISAAKVVGHAAKLLVDAADKVVAGKAIFEELMVASQEIAAATAQLVVPSRVKADRDSERMTKLSHSSKSVTEATAQVVATAKSCAQLVEDKDTFDFSKLSEVQAKKLQMESKIREKQLETQLIKEREKLALLRKSHYHLSEQFDD